MTNTTKNKEHGNKNHKNYTNSSKRKKKKYPGLEKSLSLKRYSDWIDYDYIDQLSDEEKKWLSDFTIEALGGDFRPRGKDNAIHNTPELKKECYGMANRTDRDLYNVLQRTNNLYSMKSTVKTKTNPDGKPKEKIEKIEDVIIDSEHLRSKVGNKKPNTKEVMYDSWITLTEDDIIDRIDNPEKYKD